MRLVKILVTHARQDEVLSVLDDLNVDHVTYSAEEPSAYCLIEFPLPVGVVDEVLDAVRDRGVDISDYTIVSPLETATTRHFAELEERHVEESTEITRISHAELRVEAQEQKPNVTTFVILSALSSMVAAAGLLLDSAIVITGAMVLAPLLGTIVSASVGLTIDDRALIKETLKHQPLGLGMAILGGVTAAFAFRWVDILPSLLDLRSIDQIASFSTPNALVVTIALIAGIAVALTVAADISSAFAGIAVAAAIVPSASTIGIGLVWGDLSIAFGAFVLLIINVVSINAFAAGTFFALGYRPEFIRNVQPRLTLSLRTTGVVLVVILAVLLAGFTVATSYQYITFHQEVNRDVESVLERPAYEEVHFVEARSETDLGLFDEGTTVTVIVATESERSYPELASELRREISTDQNREVRVRVRILEYRVAGPEFDARHRAALELPRASLDRLTPLRPGTTAFAGVGTGRSRPPFAGRSSRFEGRTRTGS